MRDRRWIVALGLVLGVSVCLAVAAAEIPTSDHFDGKRFHNEVPDPDLDGFGRFLKWMLHRHQGPWRKWTDAAPGPPPPRRVEGGSLRVTFANHATTLIQMDGLNILTDPIWSERSSPFSWIGPKRVRPPGIRFEDLPPVDVVVVSHNHFDHMDLPTLRRLAATHHPRIFVGLRNSAFLASNDVPGAVELDWWQTVELAPGVTLTAVPAKHFSGRTLGSRDESLWCGYVIRGPAGVVYFAGDTAMGPHFQEIRERIGPPRLALLPIGAYKPECFMSRVHESPAEALQAHEILGASTSVAMHFGTFPLGDDGEEEAPTELAHLISQAGTPSPRFWVLGFGEGRDVPSRVP